MRHARLRVLPILLACLLCFAAVAGSSVRAWAGEPSAANASDPARGALSGLKAKYRRPPAIPYPPENSYSVAKAQLGRTLFFDASLSADGSLACASCHKPELGWRDGLARGIGRGGVVLARRTPAIVDLAWAATFLWDGRIDDMEQQAVDPIRLAKIGNRALPELSSALQRSPTYRAAFACAFGDEAVTQERIGAALATFERTVVSRNSAFDDWIEGDEAAISADAKHGFMLFNGPANCAACHSGWRFTDDGFHDIGLPGGTDLGRGALVPGEPTLLHAFKTPTLRAMAMRGVAAGPFMHDGSVATMGDVLTHYASGFVRRASLDPDVRPFVLNEPDRGDLLAFLASINARDDTE